MSPHFDNSTLVVPKQLPCRVVNLPTTVANSLRVDLTAVTLYLTLPTEPCALGTVNSLPNGVQQAILLARLPNTTEHTTHPTAAMDLSSLKDQVSNLTLYDLKAGFRKAQNGTRRQRKCQLAIADAK
jgi:hypothetical protein